MAFQPVENTAQIDIMFSYLGSVMQNSLHAEYLFGAYDQTALASLANAVDAWVVASYKPLVSNVINYDRVEVRGLAIENDLVEINLDGAGVGGVGVACLPLNVTKCISLRSGLTGRSARGRFYSIGMVETHMATTRTIVTTTYESALIAALTALVSSVFAVNWVLVITSRWHNKVKRDEGVNFPVAEIISVNRTTDSMRSRLPATA